MCQLFDVFFVPARRHVPFQPEVRSNSHLAAETEAAIGENISTLDREPISLFSLKAFFPARPDGQGGRRSDERKGFSRNDPSSGVRINAGAS